MLPTVASPSLAAAAPSAWRLKLLFDGACPLCRREVAFLRRRDRAGRLAFEDIAAPGFDAAVYGVTLAELHGVMHAVRPDGQMLRRMDVFREAYRLVGLGWLVAPTAWPGLRRVFDRLYAAFAARRVRLGRLFGRQCPAGTCEAHGATRA